VGSDLKVRVASSVRCPDALIVCAPVPRGTMVVTDPVVMFEVLSPSTSDIDRIQKNRKYRLTPSIRRYVILEQRLAAATVYSRAGESRVSDVLLGDAVLDLPEVGVPVPMSEICQGIEFPEPAARVMPA
jgi:Uma2 family endonuclease